MGTLVKEKAKTKYPEHRIVEDGKEIIVKILPYINIETNIRAGSQLNISSYHNVWLTDNPTANCQVCSIGMAENLLKVPGITNKQAYAFFCMLYEECSGKVQFIIDTHRVHADRFCQIFENNGGEIMFSNDYRNSTGSGMTMMMARLDSSYWSDEDDDYDYDYSDDDDD